MTNAAQTISFKCPPPLQERLPAPGNGRSRFIVQAIAEKMARREKTDWKPTTERGRKLAALVAAGRQERGRDLTDLELEQEIRERRGGVQFQ